MSAIDNFVALVGRIAVAWLFVPAGWGKIMGFTGTAGYIASKGLPMPSVLATIAIVVELIGGLAVLAGYRTRLAAGALAVFTLVAALFFHNFWAMPAEQQMINSLMFNKNIAIFGGLLFLVAFGAGGLSVDGRRKS